MLTKVYLDGQMGEKFGREWELKANTPSEALKIINANHPEFTGWLRKTESKYCGYQVVVEYENGKTEDLSDETYTLHRVMKSVRFVPVIHGSGKWVSAIVGVVLVIVGVILCFIPGFQAVGAGLVKFGLQMVIIGVISALTTKDPAKHDPSARKDPKTLLSSSFGNTTNTVQQGVPVPMIYGRMLVGSHVISAGEVVENV